MPDTEDKTSPALTCPTLPQVATEVPVLIPPEVDLGHAPTAAALWLMAGIPAISGVWRHVENGSMNFLDMAIALGLDPTPEEEDQKRHRDSKQLLSAAFGTYTASNDSEPVIPSDLPFGWPHSGRYLQALMILSQDRAGNWP